MLNATDMTIDIDNRIEYKNCKPGDKEGLLVCEITTKNSSRLIKKIRWDNAFKTETEAVIEMHNFIRNVT